MSRQSLRDVSTQGSDSREKAAVKEQTTELVKRIGELQAVMFAEGKHSLLIILQGMDASGKDGALRDVFNQVNPMGCRVKSWKKPTEEELSHDFLWRIHKEVPAKGMIQIFNRSHYEDVLIQRVHRWVDMDTIRRRYDHINAFERLLQEHRTHILKFYLHVSREEQLERLNERLSDPEKMWKYNAGDLKESELWDEYMAAYEDAFAHCSPEIPWVIVPSDRNWLKSNLIANTIVDLMESLRMAYPAVRH
jgi:PPK2 family polyphosphate:nucleotide phosphotransferase